MKINSNVQSPVIKMMQRNEEGPKLSHIERFQVKGLWKRLNLDWKLDPKVNILIGINGSGKTTLLELLLFCLGKSEIPYEVPKNHFKGRFGNVEIDFNHNYSFSMHSSLTNDDAPIKEGVHEFLQPNATSAIPERQFIKNWSSESDPYLQGIYYGNLFNLFLNDEEAEKNPSYGGGETPSFAIDRINTFESFLFDQRHSQINEKTIQKWGGEHYLTHLDIFLNELIEDFKGYLLGLKYAETATTSLLEQKIQTLSTQEVTNVMQNSMDEFLDSDYYENAALLEGHHIAAYVEDFEDEFFWKDVFRKFAPSLRIQFNPNSREERNLEDTKRTGKQEVLKQRTNVGKALILCVDSDFQYLLKDEILDSPFIFQTFTYSIENHKCAPRNLNNIVFKTTSKESTFDFFTFFKNYSKLVFPLFLALFHFERTRKNDPFSPLLSQVKLVQYFSLLDSLQNLENFEKKETRETLIQNIRGKTKECSKDLL